jgi:hypothetical protein
MRFTTPCSGIEHWTLFRLQKRRGPSDREAQRLYFCRSLAHIAPRWRCPELCHKPHGRWAENPHTPLQWTQANLTVALIAMHATARH